MEYRQAVICQVVDGVEMDTEVFLPDIDLPEEKPTGFTAEGISGFSKNITRHSTSNFSLPAS